MITPTALAEDAHALFEPNLSPARARSVVSRAYYAAFHTCLIRAVAVGYIIPTNQPTHKALREFMRKTSDSTLKRNEGRLRSLYDKRITADYRLAEALSPIQVTEALEDMTEIVEALSPS